MHTRRMATNEFTICGWHIESVMRFFFVFRSILVIAVLFFWYYLQFRHIPDFGVAGFAVNVLITLPLSVAVFASIRICIILYVILEVLFSFFWLFPFFSSGIIILDLLQALRLDFGLPDPTLGLIMMPILSFLFIYFIITVLAPYYKYLGTLKTEARESNERELGDIPLLP